MERIDKYVSSLTNRFWMDRELHMDVKNELKSHLEDKVSENMASGMSEEKSIEEALKQFGPPEELANQIWKANIRRMRMRSVVKWALRVTLGPAAIAFTIFHFISSFYIDTNILLNQLALTQSQENLIVRTLSVLSNKLAKSTDSIISTLETRQQKNLTDDERFILNADAEAIAKRFPNNPVYCANDILVYLSKDRGKRSNKDSKEFSEILSKLNKGENLEPENSFYNYLKAGILMSASSGLEKNPGSKYEVINRDGIKKEVNTHKLIINDREMFERGIDEYLKGVTKPYYDAHVFGVIQEKLKILPMPSSMVEEIHSISILAAALLPHLSLQRDMARRIPAYAELLFDEGNKSSALAILKDIETPYLKLADSSQCLIELLVARAGISLVLGHTQKIYERMGMPEEAGRVRSKAREDNLFYNSLWSEKYRTVSEEDIKKHAGILNSMLCPALPGIKLPFSPMRTVEKIMAENAALELLLTVSSIFLIGLGIITSWNMWKYRKKEGGPMLYFIGWKKLFRIAVISIMLPIGVYLILTRVFPFSGRGYGLNYEPYRYRFGLEVLLGITSIFWLVLVMGFSAVRKRCLDAGINVCKDGYFKPNIGWKMALLILLVVIIVFFFSWERTVFRIGYSGLLAVFLVTLVSIALFIRQSIIFLRMRNGLRQFKLTAIRSLVPIIACSVLFTGIVCHFSLRSVERANIKLMHQPGNRYFFDEIEQSAFKYYRDYLRERMQNN